MADAKTSGPLVLDDPLRNQGTAGTEAQRRGFGLEGLLPAVVEALDRQVERGPSHLDARPTDLERSIDLQGPCDDETWRGRSWRSPIGPLGWTRYNRASRRRGFPWE